MKAVSNCNLSLQWLLRMACNSHYFDGSKSLRAAIFNHNQDSLIHSRLKHKTSMYNMAQHPKQLFSQDPSPFWSGHVELSFSLHSLAGSSSSVHRPRVPTSHSACLCWPGHVWLLAARQPNSHPATHPLPGTAWPREHSGQNPKAQDVILLS